MAQKNVLVTTMSTLRSKLEAYRYYYSEGADKIYYCDGISSLEAGTKYFLWKYRIDDIVVIGSKETGSEDDADILNIEQLNQFVEKHGKEIENNDINRSYTAYEFYRYRIAIFLLKGRNHHSVSDVTEKIVDNLLSENEKKLVPKENLENNIRIHFVPEQLEGNPNIDNISGIVKALRGNDGDEIDLYIDMQGGNRTSGYVRNAALSILSNQNPNKIVVKEIVATNYNIVNKEHQIVDETSRYRILDLASGMNAFIQYGKADMIQKYCEAMKKSMETEETSPVDKLVEHMREIDEAISLCDVNSLVKAIKALRKKEDVKEDTYVGNIFHILQDGIRNDYGELLNARKSGEEVDYLELISWCERKGFVQQALTLIEDKMPEVYIGEGKVISWESVEADDEEKDAFLETLGQGYEKDENKIFNSLEGMCTKRQDLMRERKTVEKAKEELVNLKNKLTQEKDNNEFTKKYCQFRRWEKAFEKNREESREVVFSDYKWEKNKTYYSIVRCCEEEKYRKDKKIGKNNNNDNTIKLNVKIHPKLTSDKYKKETDKLFLLHKALKEERNCSNHASDKGVRLPIEIVRRAIKIYVKWAREILSQIS